MNTSSRKTIDHLAIPGFLSLLACCYLGFAQDTWGAIQADSTGFEVSEGYTLGDLDNQGHWKVEEGYAEVWDQVIHSGSQAARLGPRASVSHPLHPIQTMIEIKMSLQAVPSDPPTKFSPDQVLALYLDRQTGIMALDANGFGGGQWISTGFSPEMGTWFDVAIRINLLTNKWSLSLDGMRVLSQLGLNYENIKWLRYLALNAPTEGDVMADDFSIRQFSLPRAASVAPVAGFGFEPEEGFELGNLHGQVEWLVKKGNAEVEMDVVHSGIQAARLHPDTEIDAQFHSHPQIQAFTAYIQAVPSPEPELPIHARSALVYYDKQEGLMGFHGDGMGGGSWVASGIKPAIGTWFKLTIYQDFTKKTWSASVDDQVVMKDLGFFSDQIRSLSQIVVNSPVQGEALVDHITLDASQPSEETRIQDWLFIY